MRIRVDEPFLTWLPLTPRGVAAFSRVSWNRVCVAQLIFAGLAAVAFAWLVQNTWFAAVREAIEQLPAQGQIQGGRLDWTNAAPVELSTGRFLKLSIDPEHSDLLGQEADIGIELGRTNAYLFSLLGYVATPYPDDWTIALNRPEFEPWWGAREPFLVLGAGVALGLSLLLLWWLLGIPYGFGVWVLAFVANRDLGWRGAGKLAQAAQLPGGLLLALSFVAYRLGWLSLLRCGLGVGLSFAVAWFYLIYTPFLVPPDTAAKAAKTNPFTGGGTAKPGGKPTRNPFAVR